MPLTSKGIPYPDPLDPVANGDLAIKALADWLTTNGFKAVAAGQQAVNFAAAATAGTGVVNYPAGRFTAAPVIIVSCGSGVSQYFAVVSANSAASFQATARRADGTSVTATVTVYWVAVQLA